MLNAQKSKERASISLSLDWDTIFKKGIVTPDGSFSNEISFSSTTIKFSTGSSYTGKWNSLGMTTFGTYTYPHGCQYTGGFEDGMFHGRGTLTYPMGQKLAGVWHRGKMLSYKFIFVDGMEQDTTYCEMPDRRFTLEIREGLQPAGREYLTNNYKARTIPDDCYDTVDGFFSSYNKCILMANDPEDSQEVLERTDSTQEPPDPTAMIWGNAITVVPEKREQWIRKHCRKAWDEPAGYRPDFYERWMSGRWDEQEAMDGNYNVKEERKMYITESQDMGQPVPTTQAPVITPTTVYAGTGRKLLPGSSSISF